jgi:WD40 repeat protein
LLADAPRTFLPPFARPWLLARRHDYGDAVALVDLETGKIVHELKRVGGKVVDTVPSPDGRRLSVLDARGRVTLWDLTTRTITNTVQTNAAADAPMAFSLDARLLALGGRGGEVLVLDAITGRVDFLEEPRHAADMVSALSFAPDGQRLMVGTERGRLLQFALRARP